MGLFYRDDEYDGNEKCIDCDKPLDRRGLRCKACRGEQSLKEDLHQGDT